MRLVNCFIPLLAQLRAFAEHPGGDVGSLAGPIDLAIAQARRDAQDAGYAPAEVDDALYAVVAWADEMLLAAAWDGAAQWQRHLLQRRYFDVHTAGVGFFERLDRLGAQQNDVREVYFLCLGLGFGGRYAYDRNQKALTDIKRDSLARLLQGEDGLPGEVGRLMFPDGYGDTPRPGPGQARHRWHRPLSSVAWVTLLLPLAILIVLYGTFHVIISEQVGAILPHITL